MKNTLGILLIAGALGPATPDGVVYVTNRRGVVRFTGLTPGVHRLEVLPGSTYLPTGTRVEIAFQEQPSEQAVRSVFAGLGYTAKVQSSPESASRT